MLKNRSALVSGILVAVITVLAAALRLYRLDAQSLWYDEGFSVYLARMDLAEITSRTAADIQPPLYYYLLKGWIAFFGDGERAVRGLSVLWGVLTVPLIYGVALYLFRRPPAGILAALFLAAAPLHIWYSQEVRMYTLLTLLCLLSSYLLLLLTGRRPPRRSGWLAGESVQLAVEVVLWAVYTATNVAALYTHYFALFVLVFHALYLLAVLVRSRFRPVRTLLAALSSGALTFLAFLPWLPNLLARYGADVSYWPGRLKLDEILVDIALFFAGGEAVSEETGLFLAVGVGAVLALCLAALGVWRAVELTSGRARRSAARRGQAPKAQWPLLFLLLYLLVPAALILVLSYNAPKFNARYVMLAHPPLLLLLAGGLALLAQRGTSCLGNLSRWGLAGLGLAVLLGVSAYGDAQIYRASTGARADFRGVVQYLRQHVGPEETVILCSGHAFPIFDYYAAGMERHLLPDSPTLDTTRTLDYSIAGDLNLWLAGRGGVWLVLWQDEVVDPLGYLPAVLESAGQEQEVQAGFAQVRLRHFRLPAGVRFADRPTIAHPAQVNFGNQVRLLGYNQTGEWQVTLFWEALRQLDEDLLVSVVLRDTLGQSWGRWDGRPAAYLYPTMYWRPGQIVFGRYDLVPLPGTPPGDYGLDVGVYTEADPAGLDVLDEAGAAAGKRVMLGAVRLSVPATDPTQLEVPHPTQLEMGGGLSLIGWNLDRAEAQPGDRILLTLVWSVKSEPLGDYGVEILVTDEVSQALSAGIFPTTNLWHPTRLWLPGQAWRGQSTFRLPTSAQPGPARLAVRLVDQGRAVLGPAAELTSIQVLPTQRTFTAPQPQVPRPANFGDLIGLVGADLAPDPVDRGGVLRVTLYWLARAETDVPYSVFVHLLGIDGMVVAGHDGQPAGGARPTTGWVPGEFVADTHDLAVPAELPPGDYVVEVGLYDAGARGLPRLPIVDEEGQSVADTVIFLVQVH